MFSAIVTAHNADDSILDQLFAQTQAPDEILFIYSDMKPKKRQGVTYIEDTNRNDWGHNKRKIGVQRAESLFLGFFNSDDKYDPDYIKTLLSTLKTAQDANFVYCNFTSHLFGNNTVDSSIEHGKITSGNFIVDSSIAKETGYNHNVYHADWLFISDMLPKLKPVKADKTLYNHR